MSKSQWLAIEWDTKELRALLASGPSTARSIQHALTIPFGNDTSDHSETETSPKTPTSTQVNLALAQIFSDTKISTKHVSSIAIPSQIVMRHLKLPHAPAEELPAIVGFEMRRENTADSEAMVIDFCELPNPGDETHTSVLTASLNQKALDQHLHTLQQSGLQTQELMLRGQMSGSALQNFLKPREPASDQSACTLLIDFTADSACLTILQNSQCLMIRSRFFESSTESNPVDKGFSSNSRFIQEVRRTIAAFQVQFPGKSIHDIRLAGDPETDQTDAEFLSNATGLDVMIFNPLDLTDHPIKQSDPSLSSTPAPQRFAALTGLHLAPSHGSDQWINLINPRKPARPQQNRRKQSLLFAGVAAAVLIIISLGTFIRLQLLQNDLNQLNQVSDNLKQQIESFGDTETLHTNIGTWKNTGVNWLDELLLLTKQFPKAQDAYVTQIDFLPESGSIPRRIRMDALAAQRETISNFEQQLIMDDEHYRVSSGGAQSQQDDDEYSWNFDTEIQILSSLKPKEYEKRYQQPTALPTNESSPDEK